jgi:hypothetical protein
MKFCISANKCPCCGKSILQSGNLSAFVPICELLKSYRIQSIGSTGLDGEFSGFIPLNNGTFSDLDVESLATQIISTFNVRLKSDKAELEQTTQTEVEPGSDDEYKQKQMFDAKARLQQLRDEALNEAIKDQWGLNAPGEEPLDPDIGEALAQQINPQSNANAGQALLDQRREQARQNMINGAGNKNGFRRS